MEYDEHLGDWAYEQSLAEGELFVLCDQRHDLDKVDDRPRKGYYLVSLLCRFVQLSQFTNGPIEQVD